METGKNCMICSVLTLFSFGWLDINQRFISDINHSCLGQPLDIQGGEAPVQGHQPGHGLTKELNSGIPDCKTPLFPAFYMLSPTLHYHLYH